MAMAAEGCPRDMPRRPDTRRPLENSLKSAVSRNWRSPRGVRFRTAESRKRPGKTWSIRHYLMFARPRIGARIALAGSMESFFQDVRFALRSFVKQPSFAVIAIATLALGIGANTAVFTVVNAVVLEPLPFPASDRLVRITADLPGVGTSDIGVSPPELFDYRDRSGLFDEISGVYPIDANLTEVDLPERVEVLLVSPAYFSVLGVQPQLGRFFGPEANHPGIAEVVVISDALWKRRFGGAPDAIGRKLRIDADWYTVVGVTSPEFRHPGRSLRTDIEMWAPSGYRARPFPEPPRRGAYFL